jgi:hypothetical protein
MSPDRTDMWVVVLGLAVERKWDRMWCRGKVRRRVGVGMRVKGESDGSAAAECMVAADARDTAAVVVACMNLSFCLSYTRPWVLKEGKRKKG